MNTEQRLIIHGSNAAIALACAFVVFQVCALDRLLWPVLSKIELPIYTRVALTLAAWPSLTASLVYASVYGFLWLMPSKGRSLAIARVLLPSLVVVFTLFLWKAVDYPRLRLTGCLCGPSLGELVFGYRSDHHSDRR